MNLNKKIGPLPTKAWLGIGAVGIIGGLWLRSHNAASASSSNTTDPNIDPATGVPWAQELAAAQAANAANNSGSGDIAGSGGGSSPLFPAGDPNGIATTDPGAPTDPNANPPPTDPGNVNITINPPVPILSKGITLPGNRALQDARNHRRPRTGRDTLVRPGNPPRPPHPETHRPSNRRRTTTHHNRGHR